MPFTISFSLFLLGCLPVLAAAGADLAAPEGPPLRVMSFNLRTSAAADGDDAWPKRAESCLVAIARFDPDVIGFQEVMADQHDFLVARLPDYTFTGGARDDGQRRGEWSLLGFKQARFEAGEHGDFWLSEQPGVPGSMSWDAAYPRLCSWVRVHDREAGRDLLLANTHFDHRGERARREAAQLITRRLTDLAAGAAAVLTGDLNCTEDDPVYAILVRSRAPGAIRWLDAYRSVHPQRRSDEATFHGFKGMVEGSRIDYILHTADFVARAAQIERPAWAGRHPSDHYPVTSILVWRPDGANPGGVGR